jgi:hypothetical protein
VLHELESFACEQYGWLNFLEVVMATALNEASRVREIRRELIAAGACPFEIAATALARAERLEQQLIELANPSRLSR